MSDIAKPEDERGQALWSQAMALWVQPEIERRQKQGLVDRPFVLKKWQVVFFPDRLKPEVRLNDETRIIATFTKNDTASFKQGDQIFLSDVEDILPDTIRLTDDEIDAGHISAFQFNRLWYLKFDARYNRGKVKSHLIAAQEFVELSKYALKKGLFIAFADNCFSAAELLAKAELLLIQQPKKDSHKAIQIGYNRYVKLGNAPDKFRDSLNSLSGFRIEGRYQKSTRKLDFDRANEILEIVIEMKKHVETRL
ncbi:MAG: HEPN domain-containing protein [Actinomycetota bacterium]